MAEKYSETKQTFEALINLGAESKFISFKDIYNEVKRIRKSKGDPENLKGRVRRSLINKEKTLLLNNSKQSREFSIALKFRPYEVVSKHPVRINEKGLAKDISEIEENGFMLVIKTEQTDFFFPNEINSQTEFREGKTKQVLVNSYERNSIARKKCIEHFGLSCRVCDFNFKNKYGELGKDFIHVHHIVDISSIGDEYVVNPLTDLIPVCPNCHSMLHKKRPAYSIKELKQIISLKY